MRSKRYVLFVLQSKAKKSSTRDHFTYIMSAGPVSLSLSHRRTASGSCHCECEPVETRRNGWLCILCFLMSIVYHTMGQKTSTWTANYPMAHRRHCPFFVLFETFGILLFSGNRRRKKNTEQNIPFRFHFDIDCYSCTLCMVSVHIHTINRFQFVFSLSLSLSLGLWVCVCAKIEINKRREWEKHHHQRQQQQRHRKQACFCLFCI